MAKFSTVSICIILALANHAVVEVLSQKSCNDKTDCDDDQSCYEATGGKMQCSSVCETAACGSNAHCVGKDHEQSCVCDDGYSGDASFFGGGCKKDQEDKCQSNIQCAPDQNCQATDQGIKDCVDLCMATSCGANANCVVADHQASCQCNSGFTGDANAGCTEESQDKCQSDDDCGSDQSCQTNDQGVQDCSDVCMGTACGANANCMGADHQASCQCNDGFTGDANAGCTEESQDKCQSDDDCGSDQSCKATDQGIKDCSDVCMGTSCGPNANCMGADHMASCQCNSGFTGDANDANTGCQDNGGGGGGGGGSTDCANTLDSALQSALQSDRLQSIAIPTMHVKLGSSMAILSTVRVFNLKNLRRTGTCTMTTLQGGSSMDKTTIGATNIFFTGYLSNYGLSGILLPSSKVFFRIDIQSFNSRLTIKTPMDSSSVPTLLGYQTLQLRGIRVNIQGGPALLKKVLNLLMGVSQILSPTYFNGVINSVLNAMLAKLVQNLSL